MRKDKMLYLLNKVKRLCHNSVMKVLTSKLSSKNQVVVPADIRKLLNVKKGDEITWYVQDGEVSLKPTVKNWADYTLGLGKEMWSDVDTDKYINDLRDEWDK